MTDDTPERQESTQPRPGGDSDDISLPDEADEVSELSRHGDPSTTAASTVPAAVQSPGRQRHELMWVPASELARLAATRVAGRGIDFHAELARRARTPMTQAAAASRSAVSERARRLPPVTAFGVAGRSASGPARSGIGLR